MVQFVKAIVEESLESSLKGFDVLLAECAMYDRSGVTYSTPTEEGALNSLSSPKPVLGVNTAPAPLAV